MNEKLFRASWISPAGIDGLPVLQKNFHIGSNIKAADIFISGLGLFELYINGKKAHDTYFEPGESVYEKTVYYSKFDVKKFLNKGENVITVHLGNGFYHNAPVKSDRLNRAPKILGEYMLLCQLEITDTDGKSTIVCSDGGWKCSKSKITESVWLGGEDYDNRIEYDFSNPVSIVQNIPFKLKQRIIPPIKAIKTIKPVSAVKLENGNTLVDFGINFAGTYIFKGKAEPNTRVNFYFGELINPDGTVKQKDFWGKIYDAYIFAGQQEIEYTPKFVYHGFRYIEVEGYDAEATDFEGIMLHCDNKSVSELHTDNEQLSAIHNLIRRSIEDNMQSVITDCPHREKLGWTEVYHLLFSTVSYNFDTENYYKKLIYDLTDAQKDNGSIPSIVPPFTAGIKTHALRKGTDDTPNDPSWCGAVILASYEYYLFYGDRDFLKSVYPYMKKYISYVSSLSENHLLPSENLNRDLGDWMAVDPPSVTFAVSCVYYKLYAVMDKIAKALNTNDDFVTEKEQIKNSVNKAYYHNGYYDNNSQSANALALAYGLSHDECVLENLLKSIIENDYTLTVGEVALKPLLDVLCEHGHTDVAYKIFKNAYGGFAKTYTTLPESWSGKYSQNHAMLGAGDSFIFERIAGIQNAGIAFDKVTINPYFPDDINEFSLSLTTKNGNISVEWKRVNKEIIFNCTHDKQRIIVNYEMKEI